MKVLQSRTKVFLIFFFPLQWFCFLNGIVSLISLSLFTSLPFPPSLPLLSLLSPFLSILADFPFFFYISLIALGSLFLFHFSPLLVASIHLVHNSHSINIGECMCFVFFFWICVSLLHLCLTLCRSFFLCMFSSCIYFWLQALFFR